MRTSQSLRGLKAHGSKIRRQRFCASHDPEEGENGLHSAHFWTPDNATGGYSLLMDLIAYLDEAGTHAGTRLTVIAGWIADIDRWRVGNASIPLWAELLARNNLSHVHGTDLMSGKGPFKGWLRDHRAALSVEIADMCTKGTPTPGDHCARQ